MVSRSLASIFYAFASLASCSFMATGPPAAPIPHYMDSAAAYGPDIRLLNTVDYTSRYHNISAASNWNKSISAEQSVDAIEAGYWFLVDKKFQNHQPLSGSSDYPVVRNVKDYGAKGDGQTDDWEYIMNAITKGDRCGEGCNATSTKGAIIYFPPGTYSISKPIVQYYFTQFVGDPVRRPTIMGRKGFKGIALIDTDVYIDGGNGAEWWTNQNNFYRQIRNLILDLTAMDNHTPGGAADGSPVGIHWQVSQACTLQNIHFKMPIAGVNGEVRHLGIFMENGSGGFVSDLTFLGGKVGFIAGNQQYTARNLKFTRCETAIEMLWDWGFTWKNIVIEDSKIGIDATASGTDGNTGQKQSIGSVTILDSTFKNVEKALLVLNAKGYHANVVLDNVRVESSKVVVVDNLGIPYLEGGTKTIKSWALGYRFTEASPKGKFDSGDMEPPNKDRSLLDANSNFFSQDKPQYINYQQSDFINVLSYGVRNDGSYPNKNAKGINDALEQSAKQNKILVFPAGIYKVDDTIFIPPGSRLVGVLWSQIMAIGKAFENADQPKVLARVGHRGDTGVVEISDMLFTGSGATAGAIFMEWNVHESIQGSAAMWDTIFRVGGASGTELTDSNCHQYGKQAVERCMASTMMLHVTSSASVYMENMWFWVAAHWLRHADSSADHDVESKLQTRINVYGARGVLIESQGPSWVHSASNEHSTLYNWQLSGAKNVYLRHIQSETPYFQAGQLESRKPYPPDTRFPNDPEFPDCKNKAEGFDTCRESWALRIIKSSNVYLYGGGFYSFFQDYQDNCAKFGKTCEDKLIDTDFSEHIWLYNLYTVGAKEVISPQG
ncbi:pectin lyase-like protein [Tothia fuscella]|uniref:Pectin lyase-like protein n=1 Tax=Tothia fuscella TaxID=1048955 RepID=A0A9P4NZN2_9PEZI|nr:pectin lyase-like protein [Tothia fuscella]